MSEISVFVSSFNQSTHIFFIYIYIIPYSAIIIRNFILLPLHSSVWTFFSFSFFPRHYFHVDWCEELSDSINTYSSGVYVLSIIKYFSQKRNSIYSYNCYSTMSAVMPSLSIQFPTEINWFPISVTCSTQHWIYHRKSHTVPTLQFGASDCLLTHHTLAPSVGTKH